MTSCPPMGNCDVLLVEDNDNDVDLTLRSFRKHNLGNCVEVVGDGEAALDLLLRRGAYAGREGGLPKVILLDLKLPRVDGLSVLGAIRAEAALKEIPVVILTSSELQSDIKQAYKLGASSYIVKPVDFAKFSKAVADVGLYWVILNRLPT